ncbi:AAA family ATPase [Listeria seeligeri]|uniref:AAA family ATPase n=1 Tax=Listeria seeligeri TaxID=1640 RepID=UPI00188804E8|nr:AAA family ATPase [Listeria seeligeri]MBF2630074.1 AAA family ATPase [Listeria seeligeri]
MNKSANFIETKEYKRFAEFCDACIKYKYIGICYGSPGVGKTQSSRHYANWDKVGYMLDYRNIGRQVVDNPQEILKANTIFYTAPAERATKLSGQLRVLGTQLESAKHDYEGNAEEEKDNYQFTGFFSEVDLIIVDEVDRLKIQHFEQLREIYDENNLALILVGMPGIEKRLSRYPQLYSRIGFSHEFSALSKDETHHILEFKWEELGLPVKMEDFSDYEAVTTIIKITNGNFRLIQRLFTQIDRILEINNLTTITVEVVEAARDSLVIGIK